MGFVLVLASGQMAACKDHECGDRNKQGFLICCGRDSELPGISCIDPDQKGGEFGIYGHCIESGETFDGKVVGAQCCSKLARLSTSMPTGESCLTTGLVSEFVCSPCGDRVCNEFENRCNCPGDCH